MSTPEAPYTLLPMPYTPLPNGASTRKGSLRVSRRCTLIALAVVAVSFVYGVSRFSTLYTKPKPPPLTSRPSAPPTFDRLREWERKLPQHNVSLPTPEGQHGRYVKFSNQIKGLGWNNVLNEILLNAHLAYTAKRAYVFEDYYWKTEYYPWSVPSGHWPRTPLNALVSGPMAGGLWDEGDDAPRSINADWWDVVCPPQDIHVIMSDDGKEGVRWSDGSTIFDHWANLIRDAPKRCVEVKPSPSDGFPQTFDLWLIGSDRSISLGREFLRSPVSRLHATSPLVASAVDRNEYLFLPQGPRPTHPVSRNPYDRMMAVHIRRGDFEPACVERAKWTSTYYQWNLWPTLPDKFVNPPGGGDGKATPEAIEIYRKHCFPNEQELLARIREARDAYLRNGTGRTLDVMYMLTNGKKEWVDSFKAELAKEGWHTVVTGKDLEMDDEQIEVGMAVDMEIGRRAAVFIGNGWSSLTSNILHRRLVDDREPLSNRMW